MTTQDGNSRRAAIALTLLVLINLFNYIDRQILSAVESKMEVTLFPGTSDANSQWKMGSLNTAFMVTYMLIAPLFGFLADRMSRWFLVGIGVILWSLASGATGLAPGLADAIGATEHVFLVVFLTRCLVGVGEAAYGPVAPTVISDLYPVEKRGSVMAIFYVAIPVGSALGYVLGGQITSLAGGDWRWAFYAVVPFGILLGLWCFRMKDPPRGSADPGAVSRRATWGDYLLVLKTPSYLLTTLGMTAMTFAMGGMAFFMPRYGVQRQAVAGMTKDQLDALLSEVNFTFGIIVVVSGIGATIAGGIAGDKLKSRIPGAYFLVSAIAMGLAFPLILCALWTPFPAAWIFIFLACFCLFFNTGPINTILANVTHPSIRASAFALNILIIHALGDAISPMVIGFINDLTGDMTAGFMTVSFMCLVASILWFVGIKHLERDTALVSGPAPAAAPDETGVKAGGPPVEPRETS